MSGGWFVRGCVGVGGVEGGRRSGRCRRSSRRGGLWVLLVDFGRKGVGAEIGRESTQRQLARKSLLPGLSSRSFRRGDLLRFHLLLISFHIQVTKYNNLEERTGETYQKAQYQKTAPSPQPSTYYPAPP